MSAPVGSPPLPAAVSPPPTLVVFALRERPRTMLRAAFPRRRARLMFTRSPTEFDTMLRDSLTDAAFVDLGHAPDDAWSVAELAGELPSVPFFGVIPLRSAEAGSAARCASLGFADVLYEGVDDAAVREIVVPRTFSARFATALQEPPSPFGLTMPLQRAAWSALVAHGGRPVRTTTLAESLAVTREHLSRSFAADGAPNLKRVIDLVRLVAAAELSKNPGYDVRDVAQVLGFASSSHLSSTAQRIVGSKPASLARLRTVDLFERFTNGHGRSRSSVGRAGGTRRGATGGQPRPRANES